MPTDRLLPDVESLVVTALLADTAMAAVAGTRISTELPTVFPDGKRVKISRAGGTPVDLGTERLDRAVLQIETYGATKADAFDTAAQALLSIRGLAGGTYSAGVVTDVTRLSGPVWAPEPETFTPRYLTSVALLIHAP